MVGSIDHQDGPHRFHRDRFRHVKLFLPPTFGTEFQKKISIRFEFLHPVTTGIHHPDISFHIHGNPSRGFKFSWVVRGPCSTGFAELKQELPVAVEFLYAIVPGIGNPNIEFGVVHLDPLQFLLGNRFHDCKRTGPCELFGFYQFFFGFFRHWKLSALAR